MFLSVLFSFWLLLSSISHAQTELNNPACVLELEAPIELNPSTPQAFNLPNHLKTPLIDLTRLRIELMQKSASTSLNDFYLGELKKLKEIFLAHGYSEAFFDEIRTFFFHALSQSNETFEQETKVKTSLAQKQKDNLSYPLKGRTRQIIDTIVKELRIPEEDITIKDLEKLKILKLWSKNITELKEQDFRNLINLEVLVLSDNKLTTLPKNIFYDLRSLKKLWMGGNQLATLSEKVFQNLGALDFLSLGNNPIHLLPEKIFYPLNSLVELYIINTQLSTLPDKIFENLNQIRIISIRNNPIVEISESVFSAPGLNPNVSIHLEEAPLSLKTREILKHQLGERLLLEFHRVSI